MYWVPHLAVPNFMLVYTVNLFIHAYAEWVYRVYMHHTTLTCKLRNSQSDIFRFQPLHLLRGQVHV